jgi:hypothetical protein
LFFSFCEASYRAMATMLIMGSAASVVLIALPFLFRAQTVTYSMERERQPPFDCVQGMQEYKLYAPQVPFAQRLFVTLWSGMHAPVLSR